MKSILLCWVGLTDLKASAGESDPKIGLGPIGQTAASMPFDEINLISDRPDAESKSYVNWLQSQTKTPIVLHSAELSGPTYFGEIVSHLFGFKIQYIDKHHR